MKIPQGLDPRLWRVLGGVFVSFLGVGLTLPFLLVYLSQVRGMSVSTAALVLAWMSLVALATTPLSGRLIDRKGPWIVLLVGLAVAGLGAVGLAFTTTLMTALVTTALNAVGWTTAAAAETTLLSRLAKDAAKEWVFGGQYIVSSAGIGIGALIAGLVVNTTKPASFQLIYLVDGITYLAYAGVLLSMPLVGNLTDDDVAHDGDQKFREVLRDTKYRRFLVILIIVFICTTGQIDSGLPAYATQVADVSPRVLGFAFVANTLLVVVGQLLLIPSLVGRGRSRLLAFGGLIWACSWLVIGASGLASGTLLAGALIIGGLMVFSFGEILAAPIAPALVNDMAPERLRGSYNAAYGLTFSLGSLFGPLITAVTIGTGHANVWVLLVSVGCLTAGLMMWRFGRVLTPAENGYQS